MNGNSAAPQAQRRMFCPFYQHGPKDFKKKFRSCSCNRTGFLFIKQLTKHLKDKHFKPHPAGQPKDASTTETIDSNSGTPATATASVPCLSLDQMKQISKITGTRAPCTPASRQKKWNDIYDVIFPSEKGAPKPSPYCMTWSPEDLQAASRNPFEKDIRTMAARCGWTVERAREWASSLPMWFETLSGQDAPTPVVASTGTGGSPDGGLAATDSHGTMLAVEDDAAEVKGHMDLNDPANPCVDSTELDGRLDPALEEEDWHNYPSPPTWDNTGYFLESDESRSFDDEFNAMELARLSGD